MKARVAVVCAAAGCVLLAFVALAEGKLPPSFLAQSLRKQVPPQTLPQTQDSPSPADTNSPLAGLLRREAEDVEHGYYGVWSAVKVGVARTENLNLNRYRTPASWVATEDNAQGWVAGIPILGDGTFGEVFWPSWCEWQSGLIHTFALAREDLARDDAIVYWHNTWSETAEGITTSWEYADEVPARFDAGSTLHADSRHFRDVRFTNVPVEGLDVCSVVLAVGSGSQHTGPDEPLTPAYRFELSGPNLVTRPSARLGNQTSFFLPPVYIATVTPEHSPDDEAGRPFPAAWATVELPHVPCERYFLRVNNWFAPLDVSDDSEEALVVDFANTLGRLIRVPVSVPDDILPLLRTHRGQVTMSVSMRATVETAGHDGPFRAELTPCETGFEIEIPAAAPEGLRHPVGAGLDLSPLAPQYGVEGSIGLVGQVRLQDGVLVLGDLTLNPPLLDLQLPRALVEGIAPEIGTVVWRGFVQERSGPQDSLSATIEPIQFRWTWDEAGYHLFLHHVPGSFAVTLFMQAPDPERPGSQEWQRWSADVVVPAPSRSNPGRSPSPYPVMIAPGEPITWHGPDVVEDPYDLGPDPRGR